jgi:outer membrane protein OmpA-like peptidoglycan-associated protein
VRTVLDRRLDRVVAALDQVAVGHTGFSLYEALKVGVDEAARTDGRVEVWLSTTVLSGTTDPLSIATLTESDTDPSQAVDELMAGSLQNLDMSEVDLNLVLLTPVGDTQQPLGPRAEHWRSTFMTTLAGRLGATVGDPVPDDNTALAWHNAAAVPAIEPMADKTPMVPPAREDPSQPPEPPRFDNAAFHPDSAELVDPAAARAAVSQLVAFQRVNATHYRIRVVGYCARFGKAEGARRTSRLRAEAIAELLRHEGVAEADIDIHGKGHDERADPTQDPKSPAQRVVVISLIAR